MAKLGYTWYPKDWGNSDAVFELTLIERGLYRELIDMAMLSDNKTKISVKTWARKFGSSEDEIDGILITLVDLKLIELKEDLLFIPSCEPRLNLVRGGKKGGENKPTTKPTTKPIESLPISLPSSKEKRKEIEKEIETNSLSYEDSNLIVSAINKTFNKQCKELTPAERYDFNERIKDGYKTKDFLLAIKNLAEEDWAIKKRYSYCTPKYIARLETLQQYCIVTEKEIPENESENDREVRLFLEQQEKLKNTPFKAPWQV